MGMTVWLPKNYVKWASNAFQWIMSHTGLPPPGTTRLNVFVRPGQMNMYLTNSTVKWTSAQMPYVIVPGIGPGGLLALDRGTFRRVFGRIFGRVN